jgi:hypothetical protein
MVILILFLGYAILLADKFVKEFTALHSKQRKKPQGAGELLGLFWFLT